MLVTFLHTTRKFHKLLIGFVAISLIAIVSQISIHSLMLQQKQALAHLANDKPVEIHKSGKSHCVAKLQQEETTQCQSVLSIADSLTANTALSIDLPLQSSGLFYTLFSQSNKDKTNLAHICLFNCKIKSLFPSIPIQLHAFLI